MAFFRFSRDKRGYEHFYLVEPVTNRKGKSRPRILYWYRTPPNVKVGRPPFDDTMRRAIEAQYPDVQFDWTKIVEAPIPSADAEKWRERRRVERAERAARKANVAVEVDDESESPEEPDPAASIDDEPADAELSSILAGDADGGDVADTASHVSVMGQASPAESTPIGTSNAAPQATADSGRGARKRRRRRRGRGQSASSASATPADAAAESPVEAAAETASEAPGSAAADHASDDPIDEPSGE